MACYVHPVKLPPAAESTQLAPDGNTRAIWFHDGSIRLQHTNKTTTTILSAGKDVIKIAFSPSLQWLAFSNAVDDCVIQIWDLNINVCAGKHVLNGRSSGSGLQLVFSPDSRHLALIPMQGRLMMLCADDWSAPIRTIGHCSCAAFSYDSRILVGCSHNGSAAMWSTATYERAGYVTALGASVFCVASSPITDMFAFSGRVFSDGVVVIAAVSSDGTASVKHALRAHTGVATTLAFSPCGRRLVSVGWHGNLLVWEVATGTAIARAHMPPNVNIHPCFVSNANQLVVNTGDKELRILVLCPWSDHTHYLFGQRFKTRVFQLMCVRAQLMPKWNVNIPIELWLMVMAHLSVCAIENLLL